MKYFHFLGVFLVFQATVLFAQPGTLLLKMSPIANTNRDFDFELNLQLSITPANGISIELPDGISLVPVSAKLNGNNLWLRHLSTIPTQDSVVAWEAGPQDLKLFLKAGVLQSGDVLNLICRTTVRNSNLDQNNVVVKEILSLVNGTQVAEQGFASGAIPPISIQ